MRHPQAMRHLLFALALGIGLTCVAGESFAEWYVGGQGGVTLPNKFSNVKGTGVDSNLTSSDLKLQNSYLYGLKVGRFFENFPWLGIEADVFYTRPNIKQQTTITNGLPVTRPGADIDMVMATVNLIARYPGRYFQPYIGGGAGLAYGKISHATTTSAPNGNGAASDTSIAFNVMTGVRVFVTRHMALFTEYKYNQTTFSWDNNVLLKGDYSAHNFVAGVSVHFN